MAKSQDWDGLFSDKSGSELEFSFAELERFLEIRLPPSAYVHPTWWRSAENAPWQTAGWKAYPNLRRRQVRFERMRTIPPVPREAASDETVSKVLSSEPRLLIVGGVSGKKEVAKPARDLYDSVLWSKRKAYAEATGRPWMILSSEYGLLHPDTMIEPYDASLHDESAAYRRTWSDRVASEVVSLCEVHDIGVVELHAGADQLLNGLVEHLNAAGLTVSWPLRGRRIGEQLSWYSLAIGAISSLVSPEEPRPQKADVVIELHDRDPTAREGDTDAPEPDSGESDSTGSSNSAVFVASGLSALKKAGRSMKESFADWRSQLSAEISRRDVASREQTSSSLSLGRQVKLAESLAYFAESRRILDVLIEEPWTGSPEADDLLRENPFAFIVGVLINQGSGNAEAWDAPWILEERIGPLTPKRVRSSTERLIAGIQGPPALHRSPQRIADAIVEAAEIVATEYQGDASRIWRESDSVRALRQKLEAFPNVGPRQSARAVDVLQRRLGITLSDSGRGGVAYDADLRRVMLRSGLADYDDVEHMTMSMAKLHPDDPGSLDQALLAIGTLWCHQVDPACHACAIGEHCPKIIEPGGGTPQLSSSDDGNAKSIGRQRSKVEETSPSEDSVSL